MKLLVVLSLLAVAVAAPQKSNSQDVQILRYETDNIGLGSYKFGYEQSDGTSRDEQGELINAGTENESIVVRGSYSWLAPDGELYRVFYVADENGFQPTMENGPTGVPPPSVLAALGIKSKK